uniref:Transcriptional adaptor 1 n=1 Tax=Mus musculus TaxID=10090 RepID=D6RGB8_MOUSE
MATFVSELEAAKKNLSEALGDNVKHLIVLPQDCHTKRHG